MASLASELTAQMRLDQDEYWARLRELFEERGIDPQRAVLADSFADDPTCEVGWLVAADGRVFEFDFRWEEDEPITNGTFFVWEDVTSRWESLIAASEIREGFVLLREEA